ncbi:YdcF family protein [Paenibacillus periandrae]|uniref:YdcF family protein n=1 Tax=Paenibacillus periandrae TaxID=1761741 RepID=UPI001F089873|nr:YdcF family protein [Paenibacillus periandrae]
MKISWKLIGLSLVVGMIIVLFFLGKFLIVNDKPIESDAIIVLTGGGQERIHAAISLYREGFAPLVIISNAREDGIYESIIKLGVPASNIIKETKANSTYTNAQYTLNIMNEHNLKSALVVSSDYHMRRVKFNFNHIFSSSGIRLTYCAAQTEYSSKYWFSTRRNLNNTFDEYTKIIGNALGFNGVEDKQIFKRLKNWLGL